MKVSIGPNPFIQPNPVLIIGSYDQNGNPNIMTVAWGSMCCSVPPCVTISPAKKSRTCENIMTSQAFTINIPSIDFVKEVDYVGIYSGRDENKFERLGLTPIRSDKVNAPYVNEFPFILECKVIQSHEIGVGTQQFIGEVLDIKAEKEILGKDGLPDIKKVKPFVYDEVGGNYYEIGELLAKAFLIGKKENS
jgi:flavin reductase (DIM6/NTAB) family NADH-FMN oxidoreductase RutF